MTCSDIFLAFSNFVLVLILLSSISNRKSLTRDVIYLLTTIGFYMISGEEHEKTYTGEFFFLSSTIFSLGIAIPAILRIVKKF